MTRFVRRAPVLLLLALALGSLRPAIAAEPAQTVFLAGGLSPEQLLVLSANVAASRHPGVLLLDSGKLSASHHRFLAGDRAGQLVPVGCFNEDASELEERLGVPACDPFECSHSLPPELWRLLFPQADRVVVCPAEPYSQLLRAACLAGVLRAPLYVVHDDSADERGELRRQFSEWRTHTVYAIGTVPRLWRGMSDLRVFRLADEEAVAASHFRHLGNVRSVVVCNPADLDQQAAALSPLAPWLAVQKRAALLFTEPDGKNVQPLVQAAVRQPALKRVENVILLANLQAIPLEQRPNPIPGTKDTVIEMEPLTPTGTEPYTFAVGRLFHEDPGVVTLVLARERLLAHNSENRPRRALVASNSGGSLPLLETFSRNTAQELRNTGYETETLFGHNVNRADVRRRLPQQDIFLWEGHHNTLIFDYEFPKWTEPLQPSLMFVQSCLALQDYKVQPLLERGALCVVGSSVRIFSASGGAFSLSFFDALLYDHHTLGGSLRHAKNFLVTYALLKEKRLGKDARLTLANLRTAWAFSLWGDPTLRLPQPSPPEDARPAVRHEVAGNTVVLKLPEAWLDRTRTAKYQAQIPPNGRLAGLISRDLAEDQQPLVPFVFAEVSLPKAPAEKYPRLTTRLPGKRWAFCWDPRRRCGYLLAMPRDRDVGELRFHVHWVGDHEIGTADE